MPAAIKIAAIQDGNTTVLKGYSHIIGLGSSKMSKVVLLSTACYRLINCGANMPIKPASSFINSEIITGKEDYTDDFKWVVTNINDAVYTITSYTDPELYLYCGQDLTKTAIAVVATQKQYYELRPFKHEDHIYTVHILEGNTPLTMESDIPGSRVIAAVKQKKPKKGKDPDNQTGPIPDPPDNDEGHNSEDEDDDDSDDREDGDEDTGNMPMEGMPMGQEPSDDKARKKDKKKKLKRWIFQQVTG